MFSVHHRGGYLDTSALDMFDLRAQNKPFKLRLQNIYYVYGAKLVCKISVLQGIVLSFTKSFFAHQKSSQSVGFRAATFSSHI